jgi:hypothetical protein
MKILEKILKDKRINIAENINVSFEFKDKYIECTNHNIDYIGSSIEYSLEKIGFKEIKAVENKLYNFSSSKISFGSESFIECNRNGYVYIAGYSKAWFGFDCETDIYYIFRKDTLYKYKEDYKIYLAECAEKVKKQEEKRKQNSFHTALVKSKLKNKKLNYDLFSRYTKKEKASIRFTIAKMFKEKLIDFNLIDWCFNSQKSVLDTAKRINIYTNLFDYNKISNIIYTEYYTKSV